MKGLKIGAGVAVLVAAVVGIVLIFNTGGSPRQWVSNQYQKAPASISQGHQAAYLSDQRPGAVAAAITKAWKPASKVDDLSGTFLRYSNNIIAVAENPNKKGTSIIYVDNLRRGYQHWYPYVGSYWGSSNGADFRGGGPGAGK